MTIHEPIHSRLLTGEFVIFACCILLPILLLRFIPLIAYCFGSISQVNLNYLQVGKCWQVLTVKSPESDMGIHKINQIRYLTMTKSNIEFEESIKDDKNRFHHADGKGNKPQKHRYERRKVREVLHQIHTPLDEEGSAQTA